MAKKMLIDATHPEETRVVVADGNKVEEFDFESLNRRQLAGNIYLAKVTRVEPSLQAAFIEYGGNRHGFLAFSEIHPDYYQIPKADRDAIMAEERAYAEAQAVADEEAAAKAAAHRADDDADDGDADEDGDAEGSDKEARDDAPKPRKSRSRSRARSRRRSDDASRDGASDDGASDDASVSDPAEMVIAREGHDAVVEGGAADVSEAAEANGEAVERGPDRTIAESTGLEDETVSAEPGTSEPAGMETVDLRDDEDEAGPVEEPASGRGRAAERRERVETMGDDDNGDEGRAPRVQRPKARKYKIQEVVKVRQIMLVQVVKEERGNKGAALTTYLSLAGRYCVLMPNTARGGGISRKITNAADRKKLKEIAQEIDVPQGAGLIVRTAGAKRTKTEIKRDYEYLQRQWEQVRELTLKSIAPAPIYEEGNLIHRSIRDYYSNEIDEVIVEGEAGYREARDYMRLIMPSRARDVKLHEGPQPLFARYGVESYLASMFSPTVQLKSGGYIVIGVTEALVAIDVNSGKSTREGSIEETATKTNLEAADEVARQMRLRDLAGLIVIDFIDMDERRNNAAVEKRMKEALKGDRARIQMGRISSFGLMELSRQRLRPGMLEATTQACPHCHGTGLIRSDDSVALQVLRALEEEGGRGRSREVVARVPVKVANYLVNEKREHLAAIEQRYDMAVRVEADPMLIGDDVPPIEKSKTATRVIPKPSAAIATDTSWTSEGDDVWTSEEEDVIEQEAEEAEDERAPDALEARNDGEMGAERPGEGDGGRRKRRRRSRRRKSNGENGENAPAEGSADGEGGEASAPNMVADMGMTLVDDSADALAEDAAVTEEKPAEAEAEPAPKSRSRSRSRTRSRKASESEPEAASPAAEAEAGGPAGEAAAEAEPAPEPAEQTKPARKPRSRARAKPAAAAEPDAGVSEAVSEVAAAADAALEAGVTVEANEAQEPAPEAEPEPAAAPEAEAEAAAESDVEPAAEAPKAKRRGWWSFGS